MSRDGERFARGPAVLAAGLVLLGLAMTGCGSRPDPTPNAPSASSPSSPSAGSPGPAGSAGSAGSAGPAGSAAPDAARSPDWPTYHGTADRAGAAAGVPAPHTLTPGWTAPLDGAVYGQPLVLSGLVVAATENDSVYGLDLATGAVRWRAALGTPVPRSDLPCGNIDPLGITGTPAYDAASRQVFVVTETAGAHHDLVALDVATGAVRRRTSLDVTNRDRATEQQRGALAVAGGRVYVPFGGLDGDCGNYVGYVTATAVSGAGATSHYEVPTSREGGIWAPSGVAVDAGGDVWVAVGNGERTGDPYDGSDSVLRLAPDLSRRLDFFAPSTWGGENAEDADLGSTGPLLLDRGRVLISGKTGDVYLLAAGRLGGIGGQLARVGGCRGFGGAAWDVTRQAAFVPCSDGLLRVDVAANGLTSRWRAAPSVTGSPVLGGGAVLTLEPPAGVLHALDEDTGAPLASASVGAVSRFASPTPAGHQVLVPTLAGVTSVTIS